MSHPMKTQCDAVMQLFFEKKSEMEPEPLICVFREERQQEKFKFKI